MVTLAVIDHVENLLGIPGFGPVLDGRKIGRAVIERSIALADHERGRRLGGEDDDRPFALFGDAACREVLDDRGQHRVVEAFAQLDIEPHSHPFVNLRERRQAVRHELPPESPVFGVSRMQLRGLGSGGLLDGPVTGLNPILRQAVEPSELGHGIGGVSSLVSGVLPAPEDHAELRSPVAQVVVADDMMAQGLEDPGQAVANHGRADVPDVHGLGDIGRREVDHHRSRPSGGHNSQLPGAQQVGQAVRYPGIVQPDVQKARSRDLGRPRHRLQIHGVSNLRGQNTRVDPQGLGKGHAAVGLVISKLRIAGRAHGRLESFDIPARWSHDAESRT